jgi:hypothetical protein
MRIGLRKMLEKVLQVGKVAERKMRDEKYLVALA